MPKIFHDKKTPCNQRDFKDSKLNGESLCRNAIAARIHSAPKQAHSKQSNQDESTSKTLTKKGL